MHMSRLSEQIISWYFDTFNQPRIAQTHNRSPKHKDEMWALLLTQAISSFNQGLEDIISEDRRASNNVSRDEIVDFIGKEAYNKIAYLVTAAAMAKVKSHD